MITPRKAPPQFTTVPNRFPAPTWEGFGLYWNPAYLEWCDKPNNPAAPEFTLHRGPAGISIVPPAGAVASIPTRKQRQCCMCDQLFTPATSRQTTCGYRCAHAKDRQRRRDYREQLKARVG